MNIFTATIKSNSIVTTDIHKIVATLNSDQELKFTAGQFVMVQIPTETGIVERAFSIASPEQHHNEIIWYVKILPGGAASTFFKNCKKWQSITFKPSQGAMILPKELPKKIVYVATSTGIAPFISMLHSLCTTNNETEISLLFGCRHKEDIFADNELAKFAKKNPRFNYQITLSQPSEEWKGNCGRVTEHLEKLDNTTDTLFYLCGSKNMIIETRSMLIAKGVSPKNIKFEIFF